MKIFNITHIFTIIIIVLSMLSTTYADIEEERHHGGWGNGGSNFGGSNFVGSNYGGFNYGGLYSPQQIYGNTRLINRLNQSINLILNATVLPTTPLTSTVVNLWDLMPVTHRFLILNQTLVQLSFNVTQAVVASTSALKWASLSPIVQTLVAGQLTNLGFLQLTFSSWSWVSSNDSYAGSTLFTLLNPYQVAILPNVTALINQLQFSQVIDKSLLPTGYGLKDLYGLLNINLNDDFHKFNGRIPYYQVVTPQSIIRQAIYNAMIFLKTNLYNF